VQGKRVADKTTSGGGRRIQSVVATAAVTAVVAVDCGVGCRGQHRRTEEDSEGSMG
jgi:hypothetical protein